MPACFRPQHSALTAGQPRSATWRTDVLQRDDPLDERSFDVGYLRRRACGGVDLS